MITVAQLIAHLQTLPGDARVIIPGYEWGYNDIFAPRVVPVQVDDLKYMGKFGGPHRVDENYADSPRPDSIPSVLIDPDSSWDE